ncbi:transcriptional regulator [Enterococcus faecalis]|nr:transcriptional regulator [Enterococcus faecalis]
MRREYDYQKNEIDNRDGRIVVEYISCNCGMLAKRIRWKRTEYECKSCGRQYKLVFGGQYIEIKR